MPLTAPHTLQVPAMTLPHRLSQQRLRPLEVSALRPYSVRGDHSRSESRFGSESSAQTSHPTYPEPIIESDRARLASLQRAESASWKGAQHDRNSSSLHSGYRTLYTL